MGGRTSLEGSWVISSFNAELDGLRPSLQSLLVFGLPEEVTVRHVTVTLGLIRKRDLVSVDSFLVEVYRFSVFAGFESFVAGFLQLLSLKPVK